MKCPHCRVEVHESWQKQSINSHGTNENIIASIMSCPHCRKIIVWLAVYANFASGRAPVTKYLAVPRFPSVVEPNEVIPETLRNDYREACEVLGVSPKASAAISRRILQSILTERGYMVRDLAKQIDAVLNETDARKALPNDLHITVDAVRNFGNFSAHPITDQTTLQIIDVDDQEAEWCLQIVAGLFEHYYVKPAAALKKKSDLNEKLKKAGKPPSK